MATGMPERQRPQEEPRPSKRRPLRRVWFAWWTTLHRSEVALRPAKLEVLESRSCVWVVSLLPTSAIGRLLENLQLLHQRNSNPKPDSSDRAEMSASA